MFTADDRDYQTIQQLKQDRTYAFATCYDIEWGFILPCESGVVFEQQTDGCCCHHVYIEGILIPLNRPIEVHDTTVVKLLAELPAVTYRSDAAKSIWERIKESSRIDFEFIKAPPGMPPNQEGFQWIQYTGHTEGHGQMFCIDGWKHKPIVLVYPNSD